MNSWNRQSSIYTQYLEMIHNKVKYSYIHMKLRHHRPKEKKKKIRVLLMSPLNIFPFFFSEFYLYEEAINMQQLSCWICINFEEATAGAYRLDWTKKLLFCSAISYYLFNVHGILPRILRIRTWILDPLRHPKKKLLDENHWIILRTSWKLTCTICVFRFQSFPSPRIWTNIHWADKRSIEN